MSDEIHTWQGRLPLPVVSTSIGKREAGSRELCKRPFHFLPCNSHSVSTPPCLETSRMTTPGVTYLSSSLIPQDINACKALCTPFSDLSSLLLLPKFSNPLYCALWNSRSIINLLSQSSSLKFPFAILLSQLNSGSPASLSCGGCFLWYTLHTTEPGDGFHLLLMLLAMSRSFSLSSP